LCIAKIILDKLFRTVYRRFSTMAKPKRYFTNKFQDYQGEEITIPREYLKDQSLNTVKLIIDKQKLSLGDCDGGLYVGVGGISFMLYYLSSKPGFVNERQELLDNGRKYIELALQYAEEPRMRRDPSMQTGLLLGNAGVYATAALLYSSLGQQQLVERMVQMYASAADVCLPLQYLSYGSDELLVGRAGYLCGILLLQKKLKVEVLPAEKIVSICKSVVDSGREYVRQRHLQCNLMYSYYDVEYLGAAHGLSGILQMLLSFPQFIRSSHDIEREVKASVDFMLSLQQPNGNFPSSLDEVATPRPDSEELVHFCHGAPGVVFLMAKAYLVWREEKYLQSCLRCGDLVWEKGLLRKGPGICHGVAGSGYVFLLLYRLTGDKRHLHRALQFAGFLSTQEFQHGARTPDCPYSLYEGLAGTACFLSDLLQPENAEFPLFDVF